MPKIVYEKISQERKIKLLRPALKEFLNRPFEKVTVLSLSSRMKILRTDFYYYFKDKFDIFDALKEVLLRGVEEGCPFKQCAQIFDNQVLKLKGPKARNYALDLVGYYDPRGLDVFADMLSERCACDASDVEKHEHAKEAVFRLLNVTELYLSGKVDKALAHELLEK